MDERDLINEIQSNDWIGAPFKVLARISSLCSKDTNIGREYVIRALEKRDLIDENYRNILDELAISVGLYPYVSGLQKLSLRSAIQHAAHQAEGLMSDYTLHSSQSRVLRKLVEGESVVLSAPTSFGKSLLIDIVIAYKNFKNIVLIVPTLALVEETRRRMARFSDQYTIITTTSQKIGKNNIFVLTQERFLAMREQIPQVDFFVIDEFYKLSISNEGDRSTQLNQAFLHLANSGAQFYLLGPSIKKIPDIVQEKLNCSFIVEEFQTVAIELHQIQKKPNKIEALASLLDDIEGQTMIYCQSPASTRKLLKEYLDTRNIKKTKDKELLEAAKWTATNYHGEWLVSKALEHGIGIHHGRLPRSLGRFMIRAFEEGKINTLLCTSTLIEGVNTAAKNVIVYDEKLDKKPLNFFTFNNIKGRSGRMFRHFIGHVFVFEKPPTPELPFVDIPAFNPTDLTPSSLLIQLPAGDLPQKLKEKVSSIIDQDILSKEILLKHSGIEPEYLIDTAKHLYNLDEKEIDCFCWTSRPQYEEVQNNSEIIWNQLNGKNAARQSGLKSASMMTYWIWELYKQRSISKFRRIMIQNQINNNSKPDDAVENVLAFLRGWASYNYPKYLMALSDIANFVLTRRGRKGCNYASFATSIEHLFQPSSFSSLEEFGLPFEISQRLLDQKLFRSDEQFESVVRTLKNKRISDFAQNSFERRVIEDFQEGLGVKPTKNS